MAVRRETNGKAIAALALGIAGFVIFPFVPSLLAVILGGQARAEIRGNPEEDGDGLAQAGVILGWVGIGLSVLMLVLLVMVIGAGVAFF
jgi:uncharacterized protein DUF4190